MNAILGFALGVVVTLVGSFEYLNRANLWVIVPRTVVTDRDEYIKHLEEIIIKHNWEEKHLI